MAFEAKQLDATLINNNTEYQEGDALQPSAINDIVEGILHNQGNSGGSGLTEEEKSKLNIIKNDGNGDKYLADDGTYKEVAGGSSVTVDSELSTESTNPVQNKVITEALNNKVNKTTYPTDLQAGVCRASVSNYSETGVSANQSTGLLYLSLVTDKQLREQTNPFNAVSPAKLARAIKQGLINPDIGTYPAKWTDDEKTAARQTIGATKLYKHIISLTSNFDIAYIIFYSLSNENEYLSHTQEAIWIKGENLISQPYLYAELGDSVVMNGKYGDYVADGNTANIYINISEYGLNITSVSEAVYEV